MYYRERILIWMLLAVAAAYLVWSMLRSIKWMRLQAESAERQKCLVARSADAEQTVMESIRHQEEQIRLMRVLVAEICALREESAERQKSLVTRAADAEQGVRESIRLQEEQLRLMGELVRQIEGLRGDLERRNA
jgi:predicted Holliday junction resolvase-like endonuclease